MLCKCFHQISNFCINKQHDDDQNNNEPILQSKTQLVMCSCLFLCSNASIIYLVSFAQFPIWFIHNIRKACTIHHIYSAISTPEVHNLSGHSSLFFSALEDQRQNYELNFQESSIKNRKIIDLNSLFIACGLILLPLELFRIVISCKDFDSSIKFKFIHKIWPTVVHPCSTRLRCYITGHSPLQMHLLNLLFLICRFFKYALYNEEARAAFDRYLRIEMPIH